MRTVCLSLALLFVTLGPSLAQDDKTKVVADQKKAAKAALDLMELETGSSIETKHLLVFAPRAMEKRLKSVAAQLEAQHDKALKTLALKEGDYPGKITVFILEQREQVPSFIRRIEKRRPLSGETATFSAEDEALQVAAGPPASKTGPSAEVRAGEMVATLLLQRKAGRATPLPDWLLQGFGRATTYQVAPKDKFVVAERTLARKLANKRSASEVYGSGLDSEEAEPLQGRLAEILAYGPGAPRFLKFLAALKPDENETSPSTAKALESAGVVSANLDKFWKAWSK